MRRDDDVVDSALIADGASVLATIVLGYGLFTMWQRARGGWRIEAALETAVPLKED